MAAAKQAQGWRGRWDRLADRERKMLMALGATIVLFILFVGGALIRSELATLAEENSAMRTALRDIETKREAFQRAKAKTAQLEVRMGRGGVQLDGFLEQASKEAG